MTRWLSDDAYFEVVLSLKVKRLILTELNLFRNLKVFRFSFSSYLVVLMSNLIFEKVKALVFSCVRQNFLESNI